MRNSVPRVQLRLGKQRCATALDENRTPVVASATGRHVHQNQVDSRDSLRVVEVARTQVARRHTSGTGATLPNFRCRCRRVVVKHVEEGHPNAQFGGPSVCADLGVKFGKGGLPEGRTHAIKFARRIRKTRGAEFACTIDLNSF